MPVAPRIDQWKRLSIAVTLFLGSAMASDLRIDHVTIVSPERSGPMRDATVYIHGERITSIGRGNQSAKALKLSTVRVFISAQV